MSDFKHSSVTYTSVPSPVKDNSDIGSPEVDGPPSPDYVPGLEEPEQAPLSPDYVPGPQEPEQAPPSPVYLPYVPELVYPEYMPPKDDVFLAEEKPPVKDYSDIGSPEVDGPPSPDYVPGPEEPEQAPLSPDYVPGLQEPEQVPPSPVYLPYVPELVYPEYTPPKDDVFLAEEKPVDVALGRPMSRELDYGITDTWDELVGASEEIAPTTLQGAVDRRRQGVIKELLAAGHKRQGVTTTLAARDANRNGDDSHTSRTGRPVQVARECTYSDFLKCQPLNFKGTEGVIGLSAEGVVGLSQWFEKMESIFSISNCTVACQVKFATCTLQENALTWWNSYVKTSTPEATHVKGTDVVAYSQHFQELALMCDRMFLEEIDKVESYVNGLPDTIHGSAERQADNKRKSDDTIRNNYQQPNKRQNTGRAYAIGNGERKKYDGTLPLCNKCKFHHNGQCTIKCANCKRVGHLTRDCKSPAATNNHRNLTCYEYGNQGHYRSDCPELKNQDHGNQAGGTEAHGMVHALEGGETNQDLNDVEDDINA
nr:hypothetical protein [Tanacetum cinerariifolium]